MDFKNKKSQNKKNLILLQLTDFTYKKTFQALTLKKFLFSL